MKKFLGIGSGVLIIGLIGTYFAFAEIGFQGSAFAAKNLCSGVFVSKLPAETVLQQAIIPASPPLSLASYDIDQDKKIVRTRLLGLYARAAQFRPGLGCTLIPLGEESLPVADLSGLDEHIRYDGRLERESLQGTFSPTYNESVLSEALEYAFAENDERGMKNTKAVVVFHQGKMIAERYAENVHAESPLLGWSMTKSVTNMLIGILVRQGNLDIYQPAPITEWTKDDRRSITVNDLLHMSSGLEFNEYYGLNTDVTQMLTVQRSAGAFAASKPLLYSPGNFWDYSSGTTNILARMIHQQVGGELKNSQGFAQAELFGPLGIRAAYLEPDPSGVFVGSSFLYLSARNWAKLGQLMLQDGEWKGQRILPVGWIDYSVTPAEANKLNEYGAHFWLNREPDDIDKQRTWPDVSTDAYSMNGYQGQHVVIIPSQQLVIVRLGFTPRPARPGMNEVLKKIVVAVSQ